MKLLKKLIPLGVVASVAAGVAPTLAACSTTDGWVDGTKAVDTSKFLKYDGELPEQPDEEAAEELTSAYFADLKKHSNIVSDDYAYSLNQIDALLEILPSYLMTDGVFADIIDGLLLKLLGEFRWEQIRHQIEPYLQLLISPLEGIEISTLKGQLTNFKAKEASTATYDTKFETNLTGHIGFEAYPREIIDIIEGILGFDSDFNIQIGLKSHAKVENMPMTVGIDVINSAKHSMIKVINYVKEIGKLPSKFVKTGLCMIPALKQVSLDDNSWAITLGLDLDVKLVSTHFSLDVYALTANDLKIDAEFVKDIEDQSNAMPFIGKDVIRTGILQLLAGWSTYYFSDVVFEK